MKTIKAYEYKDLSEEVKQKVREKEINAEVDFQLSILATDVFRDNKKYWEEVGCTKSYGESTPWFVPAVYYKKHKEAIDENVEKQVNHMIYNENGAIIGNIDEAI